MSKMQTDGFPTTIPFDITIGDASTDILTIAGYIRGSASGLTYISLGTGSPGSLGTPQTGDVYVQGRLEVGGLAYFDSNVQSQIITTAVNAYVGVTPTVYSGYYGRYNSQTNQCGMFGLGTASNSMIVAETADLGTNFAHAIQTNPTWFIHGADATDITQYLTLAFNNVSIGAGKGSFCGIKSIQEEITIGVGQGSAGVASSGNLAPADSFILGATCRVTDAPGGGAATFDVKITGGTAEGLLKDVSSALNTTQTSAGSSAETFPVKNAAATTVTVTTATDVTDDAMKVRVTVFYYDLTAPTS